MRAISSVGQSWRLITAWSRVQVLDGPPYSSYSNPILYEKGFGYVFVYRRFCGESMQSGKRAKAGYHCDGDILPFALWNQVRFVRTWLSPYMTHWGQSLCTCVPGACTPLTMCNTLDFVPKSVCQGVKPLRIPAERVRTYAEKWQNFTISGCSFMVECGILGLAQ